MYYMVSESKFAVYDYAQVFQVFNLLKRFVV